MFDDEDNDAETVALAPGRAAGSQAPSTWDERNSLPALFDPSGGQAEGLLAVTGGHTERRRWVSL
jgi:hypothetical protein